MSCRQRYDSHHQVWRLINQTHLPSCNNEIQLYLQIKLSALQQAEQSVKSPLWYVESSCCWLNVFYFHVQLRKNLEETIQSFRVTNEEMRDSIESQELRECNNLCQVRQMGSVKTYIFSFSVQFFWVLFSPALESAGKDARPWLPLVQNAHGSARVHGRLHRSRRPIPRLLRRSAHSCTFTLNAVTCRHVFFSGLTMGVVFLRFQHSQASSQLGCHCRISAGLEQNNSLFQTGFQVSLYT